MARTKRRSLSTRRLTSTNKLDVTGELWLGGTQLTATAEQLNAAPTHTHVNAIQGEPQAAIANASEIHNLPTIFSADGIEEALNELGEKINVILAVMREFNLIQD